MIIDAHAHIGEWEDRDLSPSALIASMHNRNIEMAVISNLDGAGKDTDPSMANRLTAEIVRKFPESFRGLVWINPWFQRTGIKDAQRCLEQEGIFVGLKFHPFLNSFNFDDPLVLPFLRLARDYQVPVAVHTAYDSFSLPERVIRVAEHKEFHRLDFILYHAGLGPPSREAGEKVIYQVAARPNLYIDNSWVSLERLRIAFGAIPSRRILFGSDLPLGSADHYQEYFDKLEQLDLDPETWELFFEGNARRLFNI